MGKVYFLSILNILPSNAARMVRFQRLVVSIFLHNLIIPQVFSVCLSFPCVVAFRGHGVHSWFPSVVL